MKTKITNSQEYTRVFREWLKEVDLYSDFCMNLLYSRSHPLTLSEYIDYLWDAPATSCLYDMAISGSFVFSKSITRSSAVWFAARDSWNSYLRSNYTIFN